MMDMTFLLGLLFVFLERGQNTWEAKPPQYLVGWSDPFHNGSLQPIPAFCPRPKRISRHAQPLCCQGLPFTWEVNGKVNDTVFCVFHATFTHAPLQSEWATVIPYEICAEEHRPIWRELGEFSTQTAFAEFAGIPSAIKVIVSCAVETAAALVQKLQVGRDRDNVLVVVPLLANLEVTQDLARHV
jgi:hypothetical protein